MIRVLLGLTVALLSLFSFPDAAYAHAVQTDYHLVKDALEIQATFSTGEAFEGADVVIEAPDQPDQIWLKGKTDENGTFAFEPDRKLEGEWSVRIGEGDHGDILSVPVSEKGIDVEEISLNPYDSPHWFARQMVVAGTMLASGLGTTWWMRRKRLG